MPNRKKWSIQDFKKIALQRNGKCLSDKYINMHSHLKFKCNVCNFEWLATPSSIVSGRWCRRCAANKRAERQKLTIEMMVELASSNNGKCLSVKYINANTHLLWKCANPSHPPFKMIPSAVKNGQWCNLCANERRGEYNKLDISIFKKIALERGGECLSSEYSSIKNKLKWRCAEGHIFRASAADVKNQGSWCTECATRWGERLCRNCFEKMFEANFPKVRPSWLLNSAGNRLELDGYCEHLKIAFEHQGEHHYTKGVFSKSNKSFAKVMRHDQIKQETCKQLGVVLFTIPEVGTRTKIEDLPKYILNKAKAFGVQHKIINIRIKPDWHEIYSAKYSYLDKLSQIAESHGGKLLESEWRGLKSLMAFRCKHGHKFFIKPREVYRGAWCQECAGNKKNTLDEMKEIAEARGGECLSSEYINSKTKLLWRCNIHNYTWWSAPSNIKAGKWCHLCAGKRKWDIVKVKKLAQERGGKCLSNKYINTKTDLTFQCNTCGNIWDTTLGSLLNGAFCPKCGVDKSSAKKRKGLTDLIEIAKKKGGKCLGTKYVNSHTPILFKCKNPRHPPWMAAPTNIRRGKWCKLCYYEQLASNSSAKD